MIVGSAQHTADRKSRFKGKDLFTTEVTEVAEKINTKFLYKGKVKDEISAGRRIFDLTWKRSG